MYHKNKVYKNNIANFAAKGAAVASVPAGAGVVVNSNSKVEIFDNDIADNQTANLIISAYFSTNYYNKPGIDPNYDPYPRAIFVYDNRFSGGGDSPDGLDLKTLKVAMFGLNGHLPDILWDGYRDEKNLVNGQQPEADRLCVRNGNVGVLNADGPHKYKNPSTDMAAYQCELAQNSPPSSCAARAEGGRDVIVVSAFPRSPLPAATVAVALALDRLGRLRRAPAARPLLRRGQAGST